MELNNGQIKLYEGDCMRLFSQIKDGSVDMVLCDLPFGITRNKWDEKISLNALWKEYRRITKANGAVVLNCQQPFTSELIMSNIDDFRYCWSWYKSQVTNFLNAKKQPLRNMEDIAVFYKKQCTYNPQMKKGKMSLKGTNGRSNNYNGFESQPHKSDMYYPTQLIDIPQKRYRGGHPTQKPVELLEYLILTYTNEGDTVLDNCMGSGSTAIACLNTNRRFIGFELDNTYFNMALERIKDNIQNGLRC